MTWTEISKEKEDWADEGKDRPTYLINGWLMYGWLMYGWLLDYKSLFGEISKLTSNWDEI